MEEEAGKVDGDDCAGAKVKAKLPALLQAECEAWMEAFPHFRISGKQLQPPPPGTEDADF